MMQLRKTNYPFGEGCVPTENSKMTMIGGVFNF